VGDYSVESSGLLGTADTQYNWSLFAAKVALIWPASWGRGMRWVNVSCSLSQKCTEPLIAPKFVHLPRYSENTEAQKQVRCLTRRS